MATIEEGRWYMQAGVPGDEGILWRFVGYKGEVTAADLKPEERYYQWCYQAPEWQHTVHFSETGGAISAGATYMTKPIHKAEAEADA